MSTRLEADEPAGRALQRACKGHAMKALACLQKAHRPEAVHNVRREIKKMRAIFRLAEDGLQRKNFRRITKSMRLSAKPLAVIRDARVTRQAFESLAGSKVRKFHGIKAALEAQFIRAEHDFTDNGFDSIAKLILKKTCRLVDDLDLRKVHWLGVLARLRKSYAYGREAYQQALRQPSPEHFHEWRKRVKDLWCQLNFLCPRWTGRSKQLARDLDQLGELLGNSHDLILLQQFADERCRSAVETKRLKLLLDAKLNEYEIGIRKLGTKIYSQAPKTVSAILEADWESWQKRG